MKTDTGVNTNRHDSRRREFLILSRQLLLGAAALSIVPLQLKASDIGSPALAHLDDEDVLVLAQVSRLLFPHDALPQSIYLEVVRAIDADMARDENIRTLVSGAARTFNAKTTGDWSEAGNREQVKVLESMQGTKLFKYLHSRSIDSLYQNRQVWDLLGYQGSSVEHGGYLHRGFDNIDWLDKS